MRYFVNENCIGCGLCAGLCPSVFSMTDAGVSEAVKGEVAPSLEPAAEDALESCPVDAIEHQ